MKKLLKRITPDFLIRVKHYVQGYCRYHWETVSVAKEINKETGIPFLTLLFDINFQVLKFVTPEEYRAYRFYNRSRIARDQILTQYRRDRLEKVFNQWAYDQVAPSLMSHKNIFYRHFSDLVGRQWLYAPDVSDQQILNFLQTQKQLIVKPVRSGKGVGVKKVEYSQITDGKAFCESTKKESLLLEEVIKQHAELNAINPFSVNTLRLNTMLDKAGVSHVLCASLRLGRGESIVDNFTSNGIVAQIDIDSGVVFTPAIGKDLQTYIKHPTSGVVIPGFQIPHWGAAKEMVLRAATTIPQIRWIGWDVAITENGPLLVEGNIDSGHNLMQLATQKGIYPILRSYV